MNKNIMKMLGMITCKEASRLMSAAMDRPLSLKEKIALKVHLWLCKVCPKVSQQISSLQLCTQQVHQVLLTHAEPTHTLSEESKRHLKDVLLREL